jgi:hypothetical protein
MRTTVMHCEATPAARVWRGNGREANHSERN